VPKGATALGEWGESRLAAFLKGAGTKPTKPFLTSKGPRLPDYLVGRIAHESKAGLNVKMSTRLRRQMIKDKELIDKGVIDGAVWHFWQGVDESVTNALNRYGIDYVVH
jgi:hypothetical protein